MNTGIVFGGASGLGAAAARALSGAFDVVVADLDAERATTLAETLGGGAHGMRCDVTVDADIEAAIGLATASGELRAGIVCAGISHVERLVGRDGPHDRAGYERTIAVNLVGTFNVLRLVAAAMRANAPDAHGERGAVVLTASVASYDGQIGQVAYASAKAGVAGMVLPAARDLAGAGIRVCAIAPGAFETPLLAGLPERARADLAANVPFPKRLGQPEEFGMLVRQVVENHMLNGEVIRLDGGLRMPYTPTR